MGIFSALTGTNSYGPDLAAPPSGGLSPTNPGDLSHRRTVPLISNQRPLTLAEAEVLEVKASQHEALAASTEQGYQAIQRIEEADLKIHQAYRGYQGKVAGVDYQKRSADTKYAEKLHDLRGKYGDLHSRLTEADTKAVVRTNAIKARVQQILSGSRLGA
jgi:hypothetical protein